MLVSTNQKFRYSKIDTQEYRSLEYPIHWLISAMICYPIYKVESNALSLSSHIQDNNFKLLMNDTGLPMEKAGYLMEHIISL